jgi:cell division transport system permease protein
MMLVGATRSFIRAPFVRKGLWHGILSALFAILLLAVLLYFTYLKIPELQSLADMQIMLSIPVGMILCGALISAISNYIAVTRFLNMNIDKLYL